MKHQNLLAICWLFSLPAFGQLKTNVPLQQVLPDTGAPKPTLKPIMAKLDTTQKGTLVTQPANPLRLPPVPVGQARYNAQYKAYQQQKLSGVKDFSAPATYVPPPEEKPNILVRKKPKHVPKANF